MQWFPSSTLACPHSTHRLAVIRPNNSPTIPPLFSRSRPSAQSPLDCRRDEFLPTVHGFDEFFGNLYQLNAEEEPENPDYPKNPEFKKRFGARGVLHSWSRINLQQLN
jgi:arylsulfatase A-like enzyme